MPLYGDLPAAVGATNAAPTAVEPGGSLTLFANETIAVPPQASIVLARAIGREDADNGITFFIEFAAAPTDLLEILGSNKLPAANFNLVDWVVLYSSTNKQTDAYTDTNRFAYYLAYLASQSAGGKVLVIAQR